ncbi:hypothetical protein MNB_SV-9-414 [hydrothermal vent metagenome]|uniref:Uncharacterized protein n=1 Tax=hydrothermal vent metagenome TaxID=652676 RepID=A0A1W1C8U1_9ZZZZ
MKSFFILEGGYLVIAFIILLITLFVSTRPFMAEGSVKKGLISVAIVLSFFIGLHFRITTNRMNEVKEAFNNNKDILCESRMQRKVAQTVTVNKSNEWRMNGDNFASPNYNREFHSARCIVK